MSVWRRHNPVWHRSTRRVTWLDRGWKLRVGARMSHRWRRRGRGNAGRKCRRNGGHRRAIGRRLERRWWYRVVRVGRRIHRVVRSGILSRRRKRALQVGTLRMSEHARCSISARRVIPARNHARNLRRRKVGHSRVVRHVMWRWRRRVVCNSLWHHRRRHRVVVGARRGIVSLCNVASGIVRVALFHGDVLARHFVSRR